MDKPGISEQQYTELVDTLHRWGLDSPELIAEMADHYAEKSRELMAQGYSWAQALNSIKTKKTYRALRRMQAAYAAYAKKSAGRMLLHEMRAALHPRYLVPVLGLGVLSFWMMQSAITVPIFQWMLLSKNLVVLGATLYYLDFDRRTQRLFNDGNLYFGWLIVLDVVLLVNHSSGLISSRNSLIALQAAQSNMGYIAIGLALSYYLNVVNFRVIQTIRKSFDLLPDSVIQTLKKHENR